MARDRPRVAETFAGTVEPLVDATSPELKALLKRCREVPADDMPRLVLADWLDEQGDGDRAAFVRVQVALSHPSADAAQQREWKALEETLLQTHFEEWIGELHPILNGLRYGGDANRRLAAVPPRSSAFLRDWHLAFRRGLIHFGVLAQSWMLDPALRKWMRSPAGDWLEQVNLTGMTPEAFERCVLPPEYFGKIHLSLWALRESFAESPASAAAQVRAPADLSSQDWQRFFRCPNFPAVRSLATDGGLAFLRELGQADVRRLVALNVRNSAASEAVARILTTIPFESLSSLDLGPVNEAALREVVAYPFLRNLTEWNLVGSPIGDGGMIALCESPLAQTLSAVSFPNTGIGDAGVQALVRSPIFANLNSPSLNLMMNRIGDAGVRALAESEHLLRYRELVLRENRCGDSGAVALAASESAANLTHLDFWRNGIGDAGAVALSQAEHLGKIVDLCVKENVLGPDGAAALFERYGDKAKV